MSAREEFRRHQRIVQSAVDDAKEQWINKVADEAEKVGKYGPQRLTSTRKLQTTHRGCGPQRPSVLMRGNAKTTANPDKIRKQWHQHFGEILNVPSKFNQEVLDRLPQHHSYLELKEPRTPGELLEALGKLTRSKTGGKTGILPELLVNGGAEEQEGLLQVMEDVWRAGRVVSD